MAPYKKVTRKEYKLMIKPWITKEILQKCKRRDSLLKRISNNIISLRGEYKKLRNEITKEKGNSKKEHYVKYVEKNKCKVSDIWKGIRTLVNIKSSKSSYIKIYDENKNLLSDSKKIANIFNDHFSTVGRLNRRFLLILEISKVISIKKIKMENYS